MVNIPWSKSVDRYVPLIIKETNYFSIDGDITKFHNSSNAESVCEMYSLK